VSGHDALAGDMRDPLHPPDAAPLDPAAAEHLLSGRCAPAQAPPGYRAVAELLAAAAAPPHLGELAIPPAVVDALTAGPRPYAARAPAAALSEELAPAPEGTQRLSRVERARAGKARRRVLRTALLAAAVVALLAGTALATGALLLPAQPGPGGAARGGVVTREPTPTIVPPAAGRPGPDRSPGAPTASRSSAATSTSTTPPATAVEGLCRAYLSGRGDAKARATAFQRLAAAAGGADRVAGYCRQWLTDDPPQRAPAPPARAPVSPPAGAGVRGNGGESNGTGPRCQPGTGAADSCGQGSGQANDKAPAKDTAGEQTTGKDPTGEESTGPKR
jgi:hypothetical protein